MDFAAFHECIDSDLCKHYFKHLSSVYSGNQLSTNKYFIFGIFHPSRHSTFVASSATITYRGKESSNNISIETSNKWKYLNFPLYEC